MPAAVPLVVPIPVLQSNVQANKVSASSSEVDASTVEPVPMPLPAKKPRREVQEVIDLLGSGLCPKDVLIVLEMLWFWKMFPSHGLLWTACGSSRPREIRTGAESPR